MCQNPMHQKNNFNCTPMIIAVLSQEPQGENNPTVHPGMKG